MKYLLYFLAIVLTPLVIAFIFFSFMLLINRIKFREEFKNRPANELGVFSPPPFLKTVFIDLPRCIMRDLSNKDVNIFDKYGLVLIVGPQGCGKTMTLNYLIRKYRQIYPRLKIRTNFDCTLSDDHISSYTDLLNDGNGIYGELDCISEIQTWFDALQSKSFPANFLSTITQQRHVRRCIISDTQVFNRISKPLRENCYEIIEPHCFFGCAVLAFAYKPILDDDAHIIRKELVETFFFIQDDELRSMYDSYSNIDYGLSMPDHKQETKTDQLIEPVPDPPGAITPEAVPEDDHTSLNELKQRLNVLYKT